MCELAEKGTGNRNINQLVFFEHTCGAQDERECTLLKHIIMAEIRKSNAPAWVSEELEKKLDCRGCWKALVRRPAARLFETPVAVHYQ